MNPRSRTAGRRAAYVVGSIAFLFSFRCVAAAAWLSESGGPDMAMASAGRTAIATDATTIGSNPAGMVALGGTAVTMVTMPVRMSLEFQGSEATPGSAVNQQGTMPALSAFAMRQQDRWAVGVGAYGNVGLGCDFGGKWSGRRAIEDAQLRSINLVPAVAYRLTDRLDVGASIGAQYADVQAGMAVSNEAIYYGPPLDLPDGQLHMKRALLGTRRKPGRGLPARRRHENRPRVDVERDALDGPRHSRERGPPAALGHAAATRAGGTRLQPAAAVHAERSTPGLARHPARGEHRMAAVVEIRPRPPGRGRAGSADVRRRAERHVERRGRAAAPLRPSLDARDGHRIRQ